MENESIRTHTFTPVTGILSSYFYTPIGQYSHDLPFKKGETITVLEPCNVIYWYLGENAAGKRGVIPINFLQVC